MSKETKILEAWNSVNGQIKDIVSDYIKIRRAYYEKQVTKLQQQMAEDAKRYTLLLSEGQINKDDYETLIKARYGQLKIELLSEISVSKSKFEEITKKILNIAIAAMLAVI